MPRLFVLVRLSIHSSLRAKRSNPELFRGGSLDCFAALATTRLWSALATFPLSSSGLTGRSSTPRRWCLNRDAAAYWMPAFAGMTAVMGKGIS